MLYFIINPTSSSGNGIIIWEKVQQILDERGAQYESILLSRPGEAAEIAHTLSLDPTHNTAVIVGGDGTINEFLQGLDSMEDLTFTCIPTGSGNDFARSMRLPTDPEDAVDMILAGDHFRNINVGMVSDGVNERSFIISSGIGFDAAVCYATHDSSAKRIMNRFRLGNLVYTFTALKKIFTMKFMNVRLIIDDRQFLSFEKTYFVVAMNTRYEGGGFMFAPKASPVDNELDLLVVEGIPRFLLPILLPTAYSGNHLRFKGIHMYRCKKAVVQCTPASCVHTDGEHFGFTGKLTFSLKQERLRTLVD